jgi:hypothetical protein
MGKFFASDPEVVIDEVEDDDESIKLPEKGKISETLRERLGKESATDLEGASDVDSVNLKIIKPRSGHEPFAYQKRLVGVIIITIVAIIGLLMIEVSSEYFLLALITLLTIGYVMIKKASRPSFESMIYIIIVSFILITGLGSKGTTGLNIYASASMIFLLLVFYILTKRRVIAIGVLLYFFWLIWTSIRVLKNKSINFDHRLTQKVILDPFSLDYYNPVR